MSNFETEKPFMKKNSNIKIPTDQDLLPHQFECPTIQMTHEHMMWPKQITLVKLDAI